MSLDDARRSLAPDDRSVLDPYALATLEPRRHRVHRRAGFHEFALAAMQDLVHDLLHPRGPAFHLRHDENVFRARLIHFGALEAVDAATPGGTRHALVLDAGALEMERRQAAVEPQHRRQQRSVAGQRALEALALGQ